MEVLSPRMAWLLLLTGASTALAGLSDEDRARLEESVGFATLLPKQTARGLEGVAPGCGDSAAVPAALAPLISASYYQDLARDLCQNPYRTLCGTDGQVAKRRSKKFGDRLGGYWAESEKEVKAKLGKDSETPQGIQLFRAIYKEKVAKTVGAEGRGPQDTLWSVLLKSKLRGDFGETLESSPTFKAFPDAFKKKARAAVEALEIVTPAEFLGGELDPELNRIVKERCGGEKGLKVNAFAPPDLAKSRGKPYLILCPGMVVEALANRSDIQESLPLDLDRLSTELLWTVGHEIAHSIDSQSLPSGYSGFAQCFGKSYASQLKGRAESSVLAESVADIWAAEHLLRRVKQQPTLADRLTTVVRATESLCLFDESDHPHEPGEVLKHPDVEFRLNELLGKTEGFRDALGCDPAPAPKQTAALACSFNPKLALTGGGTP